MTELAELRQKWNATRLPAEGEEGHYESWFQRANHPDQPLAFWIRYTLFVPRGRRSESLGELWAVWFDGEVGSIVAVKEELPLDACAFSREALEAKVGEATVDAAGLRGAASTGEHSLSWELSYSGGDRPLLLLPERLYERGFPKAKALVGSPNAIYEGTLSVDGRAIEVDGWRGSQNHNWGSRHTDHYAWGQVAGFDDAPDSFLECSTARIKIGPVWTPFMTLLVLRHEGEEYALNSLAQAVKATGRFSYFDWRFDSERKGLRLQGGIHAPAEAFVALPYNNPPGGLKTCLNSKIAACEMTLERPGAEPVTLQTQNRAAFEILTDDDSHGVALAI